MSKIKYIAFSLLIALVLMPKAYALSAMEVRDAIEQSETYTEFSDMGYYSKVTINENNITLTTGGYDFDFDDMYESCAITFTLEDGILSYKADLINETNALCVGRNDEFLYDLIRYVLKNNSYSEEGTENVMNNALSQLTFMKNGIEVKTDNYVSNNTINGITNRIDIDYIKTLKLNTAEVSIEGFSIFHSLYSNYFIFFLVGAVIILILIIRHFLRKIK